MNPANPSGPILVTGVAGFIGFHLCKRLLDDGRAVVGLDNLNDYYDVTLKEARLAQLTRRPGFRFAKLDLTDWGRNPAAAEPVVDCDSGEVSFVGDRPLAGVSDDLSLALRDEIAREIVFCQLVHEALDELRTAIRSDDAYGGKGPVHLREL